MASVFVFLGGLGVFLFGMDAMSNGLQRLATNKMKDLLAKLITNKFTGVVFGALITAIIQSSTATTVMVVGFVNAGFMNLTQAAGVIMGANIGTTITSWIFSMSEWAASLGALATFLNPTNLSPVLIAVGVFMMQFVKKEKYRQVGEILFGTGLIFLGLNQISGSFIHLQDSQIFKDALVYFGTNPVLGIIAGAIVTAIVQSSAASVAILQALASEGLVTISAAIYIIMGQNIGTCGTAMLSSIGASRNAKSAAYIHLLFNVVGSIIFAVIAVIYFKFFNPILASLPISQTNISMVHTLFNVSSTFLLYFFTNQLIAIAEKLTMRSAKEEEEDHSIHVHLEERILESPSFALENTIKELGELGEYTLKSYRYAIDAIINKDKIKVEKVLEREDEIDRAEYEIIEYLVKISYRKTTEDEHNRIAALLRMANDFERIGDHCKNLADFAGEMMQEDIKFTDNAMIDLKIMLDKAEEALNNSVTSLVERDYEKAKLSVGIEESVNKLEKELRLNHLKRLSEEKCTSSDGAIFLDILSNVERIGDHSYNIAQIVQINKL